MKREGESFRQGVELAWKELQDQGLQGEMLVRDSGKDEAEAILLVQQILSDPRVAVLMVHMPMTVLSRVLPECRKNRVLLVAPANSHEELAGSSWGIPFIASDRSEGFQAAAIAKDLAKGAKIALLHEAGPYGDLLLKGFQEGAAEHSTSYEAIPCRADEAALAATLSEKLPPEAPLVFLAGSPLWGLTVADALSELNFKGRLLLPQSYGKMTLEDLADHFPDRLYAMRPLLSPAAGHSTMDKLHKAFVRAYWKKPDDLAILAYDAMNWVGSALKTGVSSREELRERLRSGTRADAPYTGAGGEVFFDAAGVLQRRMQLTLYRNGKFEPAPAPP
jgi:ABC-type branched-subunit amino acid transport system substrate-binding protein